MMVLHAVHAACAAKWRWCTLGQLLRRGVTPDHAV